MRVALNAQLAPLRIRWSALEPRQRLVVSIGAAVLLVGILIAYVWLPLERDRVALQKRLPELRGQLAAMERDAEEVKRMRTLPAGLAGTAPRALDAAQLRTNFTGSQVTAIDGGRFKVVVPDTAYAQWMDELKRLGGAAVVDEATFTATGPGKVGVDATIGPPGRKTP